MLNMRDSAWNVEMLQFREPKSMVSLKFTARIHNNLRTIYLFKLSAGPFWVPRDDPSASEV